MVRDLATYSNRPVRVAILDSDPVAPELAQKLGFATPHWSHLLLARLQKATQRSPPVREIEFSTWDVVEGQYPDPSAIDAVLLTGGKPSAYDPDPWIKKLQDFVIDLHKNHRRIRVVGICLGHQMIAHALLKEYGIYVENSPRGMQMGIRTVNLDPSFSSAFPGMKPNLQSMRLHVVHHDHVHCPPGSLPEGWMTFGKSDCCDVHGLYQPGRVLTLQSHFEMTRAACYDIIEFVMTREGNMPSQETIDALLDSAEEVDDGEELAGMIINFLTEGEVQAVQQ